MPVPVHPNRRQLLQGAAGTALVLAGRGATPAAAAPVPTAQRADVTHRGRSVAVSPQGSWLVVAQAGRRTATITRRRGRRTTSTVTLAGQPLELALDPHARLLAATTAFWDHPGLEVLLLRTGARVARVDVGPAPFAPAFTRDGRHLLVTGGEQDGTLQILSAPGFGARRTVALGRVPRGLAITPDSRTAWVALQGEAAVVAVDLRTGVVARRVATAAFPEHLALSAGGGRLLIAHGGHDATTLSELDTRTGHLRRRPAGGRVGAVAFGAGGRRLATLSDGGAIAVLGPHGRPRRVPTVSAPRGLAVSGRHAFTVSATDGTVGRVQA